MRMPAPRQKMILSHPPSVASRVVAACALAMVMTGCDPGERMTQVAGWSIVDATQRHPITVTQQPAVLSLRVARSAYGLSPQQRARLIGFLERFRATDSGNSKLVMETPSGASNEVAAMQVVAEIRHLMFDMGFDQTSITVETYPAGHDREPPVRISHLRFIAEGPDCGVWPTNLAESYNGLTYPNLGCAQQKNLAAMVSNPADLLGPRTQTPTSSEKRDAQWDKYIKGQSTISKKQEEEKVKGLGGN